MGATAAMLDPHAVAHALGGEVTGPGRVLCPGPMHSKADRSLSVWLDPAAPAGLIVYSFAGDDPIACRDFVKARLGLADDWKPDPAEAERRRRELAEIDARKAERDARRAADLWRAGRNPEGTAAARYLARRGLPGPIPTCLRFLPDAWHPSGRFPALVARVDGTSAACVHLTYLTAEGAKAPVQPVRRFVGKPHGGAARLNQRPGALVVGEGIESTLSAAAGLSGHDGSTWAALSAPGMAALALPPNPGTLILAVDADDAGRAAGRALGNRATAAGWAVEWLEPPDGQDWNDVLTGAGQ